MMLMIHNTQYIDISITISTIQLYTGSLSGYTVRHLAVVQYTTPPWFEGRWGFASSLFPHPGVQPKANSGRGATGVSSPSCPSSSRGVPRLQSPPVPLLQVGRV